MNDFTCIALPVRQSAATFYVGAVAASDLGTICRPLTKPVDTGVFGRETSAPVVLNDEQLDALVQSLESRSFRVRSMELLSEERVEPYQRFLDEKRAVQIAEYIKLPSALLPNSIILAVNVSLDESDVLQPGPDGTLTIRLPRSANSAVILDGQHRVAAFEYLDKTIRDQMQVVVAFLVGVPFYQQAEIFAVINGKQKPVNKSIIFDLFGYAPISSVKDEKLYEGLMAVSRFCSHVARILNQFEDSPWSGQIKMRGPGDVGVISQAAVAEYLSALVEPKTLTKRTKVLPLLYEFFRNSDAPGCASLVILYLAAIRSAQPAAWAERGSLLWKNNGVAVMLRLLHDLILLLGGPNGFMDSIPKVQALWSKAPRERLMHPPKTGGGGVQNELYEIFRAQFFTPSEQSKIEQNKIATTEELLKIRGLVR